MSRCSLTAITEGLALASPYDPGFIAAFKSAVPYSARAWDANSKRWIINPSHAAAVADLCETFFSVRPTIPQTSASLAPIIRVFRAEYIGACKPRGNGEITAMGYYDGAWSLIMPESVLRQWFNAPAPAAAQTPLTLYAVLGVPRDADDNAIKAGYKRMARQWHPDVCREPDAHERFIAIKAAYGTLSDPLKRRRYNAGLAFEATIDVTIDANLLHLATTTDYYRAPLRCGLILAQASPSLGRWRLDKIMAWDDIMNDIGETMVASWDADNERITTRWVLN